MTTSNPNLIQFKKCQYSELFWSVFSHIWTEYEKILSIFPYSVQMRQNTDQNNTDYGHFSRSASFQNSKNPSCINILRKNFKISNSFMKTNVFETGISDHHKMISIFYHETSFYKGKS